MDSNMRFQQGEILIRIFVYGKRRTTYYLPPNGSLPSPTELKHFFCSKGDPQSLLMIQTVIFFSFNIPLLMSWIRKMSELFWQWQFEKFSYQIAWECIKRLSNKGTQNFCLSLSIREIHPRKLSATAFRGTILC